MTNNDDWRNLALCKGKDAALWDAGPWGVESTDEQLQAGMSICAACPVAAACLKDALDTDSPDPKLVVGIRGGKTAAQRAKLRRANKPSRMPAKGSSIADRITPAEQAERLAMVKAGMNDAEMAAKLKVSKSSIFCWRKRNNIPTQWDHARVATGDRKRRELYRRGLGDTDIAKQMNTSADTVYRWRARVGLPAQARREKASA